MSKSNYPKIDIALVSGRRPALLSQTMESFQRQLFENFAIAGFIANIDPFCENAESGLECEAIIKQYFPDAKIHISSSAGFAAAVKRNWLATQSDYVLHLEDDWILLETVTPDDIFPGFTSKVAQVSFAAKEKRRNRSEEFHFKTRRKKILGITIKKWRPPSFTTSPSFLKGDFARTCAGFMDVNLDPEKQLSDGRIPRLSDYTENYLNRLYFGKEQDNVVQDIGREYRSNEGLQKKVVNGTSIWTKKD